MATPVKAYILNHDTGDKIECQFNPTDYSMSKQQAVQASPTPRNNAPTASSQGGGSATISFELFFDTYRGEEGDMKDVRDEYTNKLLALMDISPPAKNADSNTQSGRPPLISFHWGETWSFTGLLTQCNLKFTLFTSSGKPVRATASISIHEADDPNNKPKTNPTSGGEGMRANRVVEPGDTLDLISYKEYGDPTLWRHLATANNIENPRALKPGQRLVVPNI